MIIDLISTMTKQLSRTFKEAHLEGKIKFQISDVDHVGSRFTNAVKDALGATFMNDATHIIAFKEEVEVIDVPSDDENAADGEKEEVSKDTAAPDQEDSSEKEEEEAAVKNDGEEKEEEKEEKAASSDQEDEEDEKKNKKEKVNESVKVKDLNNASITVQNISNKKAKQKKPAPVERLPKKEEEGEEDAGQENSGAAVEGGDAGCCVDEAETTASGADLKKKVIDGIARCLFLDQNVPEEKVEVYDLEGYIENANIYFCKLTINSEKKNTDQV